MHNFIEIKQKQWAWRSFANLPWWSNFCLNIVAVSPALVFQYDLLHVYEKTLLGKVQHGYGFLVSKSHFMLTWTILHTQKGHKDYLNALIHDDPSQGIGQFDGLWSAENRRFTFHENSIARGILDHKPRAKEKILQISDEFYLLHFPFWPRPPPIQTNQIQPPIKFCNWSIKGRWEGAVVKN